MPVRFSAFATRTTLDATTHIVGYDGVGTLTNIEFTLDTLKASIPGITSVTYAEGADATVPLSGVITGKVLALTSNRYGGGLKIGYVPEGGSNTKFLRGDATWDIPLNTEYTAGVGLTLSAGDEFSANVNATVQTVAANSPPSATAARTYAVQVDSSDDLVVNIPWTTNTGTVTGTGTVNRVTKWSTGGTGIENSLITDDGSSVSIDELTVLKGDGTAAGANGKLQLNCSANTHYVELVGPAHLNGISYSLQFPNTIAPVTPYASGGRLLETDSTGVSKWINTSSVSGNLYTANGTTGAGRVVGVTDTLTFEESSGNVDIFKMSVDGTFSLGLNSANFNSDSVVIGKNAYIVNGKYNNVVIGADANVGANNECVAVGHDSQGNGSGAVAVGSHAHAGLNNVSIGLYAGKDVGGGLGAINIGKLSRGEGNNSITITTSVGGGTTNPTTANAFGIYMTSVSTPDFEVVGEGESTLNTSLKVTGQAYTELNSLSNTLTVSWNNSNVQTISTLTGSHTFIPTNPKAGATYILNIIQSGATTITWGPYVKWASPDTAAVPPALSGSGKTDVITLICFSATANSGAGGYYGSITKDLS